MTFPVYNASKRSESVVVAEVLPSMIILSRFLRIATEGRSCQNVHSFHNTLDNGMPNL